MKLRSVPFVLLAASAALSADVPSPTSRIPRDPEFQRRVDDAIVRGAAWLKKTQTASGGFGDYPGYPGGTTALAYFTLRVCGVRKDDASAKSAYEALKRDYRKADLRTYTAALYLMAIAEHGEKIKSAKDDRDVKLDADDMKWATEITRALAGGQNTDGSFSYQVEQNARPPGSGAAGQRDAVNFDNSNTQYALLGLKCAARCNIPIDRSVWRKALSHFMDGQEKSGPDVPRFVPSAPTGRDKSTRDKPAVVDRARGWTYNERPGRGAYASMTAAGVSSVVICRSELMGFHEMTAKLETDSEKSVWDGLAWLGTRWVPIGRPMKNGVSFLDLYEYYGVERAGVLAGVEWMATLDWYGAGAVPILDLQTPDGGWAGRYGAFDPRNRVLASSGGDVVDTCFALLFLKKGTAPVRMGAVTQGGADVDINFAEARNVEGKDLEDVIDLVLARWRRATDDKVKTRLFDGATSIGPKIVEPLLVRMDSPEFQKRLSAHALLAHATGKDFGWNAESEPDERETAVVKWQTWWIGAKERVEYDATSKRLVVR